MPFRTSGVFRGWETHPLFTADCLLLSVSRCVKSVRSPPACSLFLISCHPLARFSSPVRRETCAEPPAPPGKQHFLLRTARRDK